jgi:hypothetical protein
MAKKLVAVANATPQAAILTSTEHPGDGGPIAANAVTHTGGSDDDYIKLPACSGSQYYDDHNIVIAADDRSWTVSFWYDDDSGNILQWSPGAFYSTGNPVAGSGAWDSVSILIRPGTGGPVLSCAQWT